jgi:cytochrome P450
MPTFEDFDQLPYIRAMVKEVLRWRTASNDHFQHVSTVCIPLPFRRPSTLD